MPDDIISTPVRLTLPRRVYGKVHGASTDVLTGQRGLIGGWCEHPREGHVALVVAHPLTAAAEIPEIKHFVEAAFLVRNRLEMVASSSWVADPQGLQQSLTVLIRIFDNAAYKLMTAAGGGQ